LFLVDTSGSNVGNIMDMVSRTEDAFESVDPEVIHVTSFDGRVYEPIEVFSGDRFPTELRGGGGTDIARALRFAEDEFPDVDAIVVLTDGYDNWYSINKAEPSAPVIWLNYGCNGPWHDNAYQFGEKIDVNFE
jgi:predicted metal-dependent peptidase